MYAGDVPPDKTWQALADDPDAVLVDVRTSAEWDQIGIPDLSGLDRQPILLEWNRSDGFPNRNFVEELQAAGVAHDAPVYFLCRSGQRSASAAIAATAAGYTEAYNIAEGFEGPPGPDGRRSVSGWKVAGLPWRQR